MAAQLAASQERLYSVRKLKIAKVKPFNKKGLDTDIGNYRPLSLISVLPKIIEKIMHKRLILK
jgi:hypothetical protein